MLEEIEVRTPSHACLVDVTATVAKVVSASGIRQGICCVYVPHTTAGITINENADPAVRTDIVRALDKVVPWDGAYDHEEGNTAAHVKASLMGSSQSIFIDAGRLRLGTWQGIYLAEFDGPRSRRIWIKLTPG